MRQRPSTAAPGAGCYSGAMSAPAYRLTPATALMMLIPPLLWAGNAVIGRVAAGWIPPFTFNFLRWALALLVLLPLAGWVLRPGSPVWQHWRRYAVLGALAITTYNSLLYLALQTSSPVNVTLVAASMPVWMLLVGRIGYGVAMTRQAWLGAALSLLGVVVVLTQGQPLRLLQLDLVAGDAWMLLAALAWACYSWLLTQPDPCPAIRQDWAAFLLAQMVFGLLVSGVLMAGEWLWLLQAPRAPGAAPLVAWGWPLLGVLVFVAIGPAVLAYRFWGAGVQRVGPTLASFFANLTPLFAAILSTAVLGELPQLYHGMAFALLVAGIAVSARKA